MATLARAGLVVRRREGRRQVYRLRPEPLREVIDWTAEFDAFWDERFERLGQYLENHD